MNVAVSSAIIGGAGLAIVELLRWFFNRKKNRSQTDLDTAQAASIIQGAAVEMLAPLRNQISELKTEVEKLKGTVRTLQTDLDAERVKRENAEVDRDRLLSLLGMEAVPQDAPEM